jgi:hypothetical protein
MKTPPITVPWPENAHQWEIYATVSRSVSEYRREVRRRDRAEVWREAKIDFAAAVLGVLCATILVGLRMLAAAL